MVIEELGPRDRCLLGTEALHEKELIIRGRILLKCRPALQFRCEARVATD